MSIEKGKNSTTDPSIGGGKINPVQMESFFDYGLDQHLSYKRGGGQAKKLQPEVITHYYLNGVCLTGVFYASRFWTVNG